MRPQSTNSVLRHLRQIVLRRLPDGLTDAQLLEAFLTQHEEAAFAALVRRHGPMVYGTAFRPSREQLGDSRSIRRLWGQNEGRPWDGPAPNRY